MKKILYYLCIAMAAGGVLAGTELYNAVFYGSITAGEWNPITGLAAATATNGTYTNAATWYYRITATNSLGRFPYSTNTVTATVDGVTNNGVTLTWDYTSRLQKYIIERGTNGTDWDYYTIVSPAVTSAFDDGNLVWTSSNISGMSQCTTSSIVTGTPVYAEADPVFTAHTAYAITSDDTDLWHRAATDASAATNDLADHIADTDNPHSVTPTQIGALAGTSNLSDVADAATARSNLGAAAQSDLDAIISQTNQIIDVAGTAYTITNSPTAADDVLIFTPAATTAYFAAQSGGGSTGSITLAGAYLAVDSISGWGGYQTGSGSTTNNAIVVAGYSSPNATNNINSGWAFYSAATNVIQDKYAYARIPIPPWASSWAETAIVFRVRTSSDSAATNYVDLLLDDGSTAFNTGLTNLVSTTTGAWLDVPVLASALPAAWTNDLDTIRPALSLRGDYFAWQSNYCQWVEVQCIFE